MTFKEWFDSNLKEYAQDIANGADGGFPGISYISESAELFDRFGKEIWDMVVEDANQQGYRNVAEMIGHFNRSDMLDDFNSFKNLMVWYACEKLSRELIDE